MKPIASAQSFRSALLASVAAGVLACGSLQAYAEVGVAAAVNIDARGRPPGAAPRVISLGTNVVFNEEITTDQAGLVQILLLDGTTFTVGPNSQLTIDEFVYDPGSGDAKVVATLTKGVFRFVGARTSQKDGGATVRTPVGTIGIRGAVTNISYDPGTGESKASLVAGNKLTITDGDGTQRIVYETGYTAVITRSEGGGTTTTIRKSTREETGLIQQQLAGKQGQNGGASTPPTDETVANSQVGQINSNLPDTMIVPGSIKPVQSSEPDQVDEVAGIDGKTQDDIDNDIDNGVPQTLVARLLTAPDTYVNYEGQSFPEAGGRGLVGSTTGTDQIITFSRQNGRLVATGPNTDINLPDYSGSQGDTVLSGDQFAVLAEIEIDENDNAFSSGIPLEGKAYAGVSDFAAYMLGFNGDPTQPFYAIFGTPTNPVQLAAIDDGDSIREYSLTQDPIRPSPLPFFSNEIYQGGFAPGTYHSSNMIVVEPGGSDDIRAMQTWVSIEGTGPNQKSGAFVFTGPIYLNDDSGEYQLEGGRRGSFRASASTGSVNMRGGLESIAGANTTTGGTGSHFFGPNANNFVVGAPIDNEPDNYTDSPIDPAGPFTSQNPADGYLYDGSFGTHHVANLVSETPQAEASLTPRVVEGFMVGLAESTSEAENPAQVGRYLLSDSYMGDQLITPNFEMSLSSADNTLTANATLFDALFESDVVNYFEIAFGDPTGGSSTFVDDDRYAARLSSNPQATRLHTDDGGDFAHDPNRTPGSYLVSGRANPIPGYEHCQNCDFIDWGWWGTRVDIHENDIEAAGGRTDQVHMGTWVAGDIATEDEVYADYEASFDVADLPFSGSATYTGAAIGTVSRDAATYIASGVAIVDYNFRDREGAIQINNFDNMSFSGYINDSYSGDIAGFSGSISENSDYTISGNVHGAFVNDGPNVAAGVIGSFNFAGSGVSATGTIAGSGAAGPPLTSN